MVRMSQMALIGEKRIGLISSLDAICVKTTSLSQEKIYQVLIMSTLTWVPLQELLLMASGFRNLKKSQHVWMYPYLRKQHMLNFKTWFMVNGSQLLSNPWQRQLCVSNAAVAEETLSKYGIPTSNRRICCWSSRSYGNNYKALSGAAAIVGRRYGEVLFLGIKNKYCTRTRLFQKLP